MRTSVTIYISDSNYALLDAKAVSKKDGSTVATMARDIVDNWCADRRAAKRLTMEQAHYTARDGSDFEEVDA